MKKAIALLFVLLALIGAGGYWYWNQKAELEQKQLKQMKQLEQLLKGPTAEDFYTSGNTLKMESGSAMVKRADGTVETVTASVAVGAGDTIKIQPKGLGTITWFDDSVSRLKEGTEMIIDMARFEKADLTETHIGFKVVVGEIWSKVRSLANPKSEFLSYAGGVVSGVRGSTYNVRVEEGKVVVESVAHAAFVAPVDPKTGKEKEVKTLVRGQQVEIPDSAPGRPIKVVAISANRLQDEWIKSNRNEDESMVKVWRAKSVERLQKRTMETMDLSDSAVQKLLTETKNESERAALESRVAEFKLNEALAQALQNPKKEGVGAVATQFDQVRKEADVVQWLDRSLADVMPDETALYAIKEAVREEKAALATDPKIQEQIEKKNEELKRYQQEDLQKSVLDSVVQPLEAAPKAPEIQKTAPVIKPIAPVVKPTTVKPPVVEQPVINLLNVPAEEPVVIKEQAPYYGGPSGHR